MPSNNERRAALSAGDFAARRRQRIEKLATWQLGDALDRLGLRGAVTVIDNRVDRRKDCCGEIFSMGALKQGVAEVVVADLNGVVVVTIAASERADADIRPTARNVSGASARGQAGACA